MEEFSKVLANKNLDEMNFYLEYLDVLIEFFRSKKMNVDELHEERTILTKKIKQINQKIDA